MKMIFFSSDRVEVEALSRELSQAGIACEVRSGIELDESCDAVAETELWIIHDHECHSAFMFCVEREAGFAKRAAPALSIDDLCPEADLCPETEGIAA